MNNLILNTDAYKVTHHSQLPPYTEFIQAYIEARDIRPEGERQSNVMFVGLQMFIKKYLLTPITEKDIKEAGEFLPKMGLPFCSANWYYILKEHRGYLPIRIKAVLEGLVLPSGNALVTIENTDPNCAWLVTYIETALLRAIWYPSTVATVSWEIKQILRQYIHSTVDDAYISKLCFMLHDFGKRGVSSLESAGIGGFAHLINFYGTDTLSAVQIANKYYPGDIPLIGASIPASEHSTMTIWGKDKEEAAYKNMLTKFAKHGKMVAVVSDSYDIYNAVTEIWGKKLKEQVEKSGAIVVIRPDSGDPISTPIAVIKRLMVEYGHSVNTKGYKVLPPYIRVIQGDGVDKNSIKQILDIMKRDNLSAENIVFGCGAGLLQKVNRDTYHFAMKVSAAKINGKWREVYKDPVNSKKKSKRGYLDTIQEEGKSVKTISIPFSELPKENDNSILFTIYENGKLLQDYSLKDLRQRGEYSE